LRQLLTAGRNGCLDAGIRGSSAAPAYTGAAWDGPRAGKTLIVRYPQADNSGYAVRTRDGEDGGLLGGGYARAGQDAEELAVPPALLYTIKEVL
jgi:hypothetical protein